MDLGSEEKTKVKLQATSADVSNFKLRFLSVSDFFQNYEQVFREEK